MRTQKTIPLTDFFLKMGILMGAAIINFSAHAQTIWTGPTTNFAQTSFVNPPQADVLVSGKVSLTRNGNHGLYNTNRETFASPGLPTPSDTEWSFGQLSDYATLTYQSFDSLRNGNLDNRLLNGGPLVCHLINENIYLSVQFTAWGQGGGLIAYTRSTPLAVAPPPTPSVTITNPANNAVFGAPANVAIGADATVSSGTITNVIFFRDTTTIGSRQVPPFTITASNLPAGNYALKAVAIAAGISATSSIVNISVVNPPTPSVTITNPANGAVFASPADVAIGANATVPGGTVTNVTFFANVNQVGSKPAAPFTITANGLANGSYALTAVATASGISATSSVVNISVVTPVVTSLTASPASVTNNQFVFSYTATPGLRYEVDVSSNLFVWTPIETNVAASSPVFVTNNISGDGRFFRVDQLPNP